MAVPARDRAGTRSTAGCSTSSSAATTDRGVTRSPSELATTCYLSPEKSADRDRWARVLERELAKDPKTTWRHFWLADIYYHGGRFAEAEEHVREAIKGNRRDPVPALARVDLPRARPSGRGPGSPRQGRGAIRRGPPRTHEGRAEVTAMTSSTRGTTCTSTSTLREARARITGTDPGPDPALEALRTAARERLAALDKLEDAHARLVQQSPNQPRLWVDRGRRFGELGRWGRGRQGIREGRRAGPEVGPGLERNAAELTPTSASGDEAAADFVKAMELAPTKKSDWFSRSLQCPRPGSSVGRSVRAGREAAADGSTALDRARPLFWAEPPSGREAVKAIARVMELDPEDHLTLAFPGDSASPGWRLGGLPPGLPRYVGAVWRLRQQSRRSTRGGGLFDGSEWNRGAHLPWF